KKHGHHCHTASRRCAASKRALSQEGSCFVTSVHVHAPLRSARSIFVECRNNERRSSNSDLERKTASFETVPRCVPLLSLYNVSMENNRPVATGRGSNLNPPNRFGGLLHVLDLEHVEQDHEYLAALSNPA